MYGSHATHHNSAALAPPSLFSQIITPSPGYGWCRGQSIAGDYGTLSLPEYRSKHYDYRIPYSVPNSGVCSPSPYTGPHGAASSSSFFGGGDSVSSPRPLLPEMYKSAATLGRNATPSSGGLFSPTAALEEVLWSAQPQPLSPLLSPPGTGGAAGWFNVSWWGYGSWRLL